MPRPKLNPSDEDRRLVKSLAAYGVPQEHIARRIGIRSVKTLRKHFREELDQGSLDANSNVATTLYKMAKSGQHPIATMFWLKCRAGWRDQPTFSAPTAPPPFIVAKERTESQI
jgi:hypothetical protein